METRILETFPVFPQNTQVYDQIVPVSNEDGYLEMHPYRLFIRTDDREFVFRNVRMVVGGFPYRPGLGDLFCTALTDPIYDAILMVHLRLGKFLAVGHAVQKFREKFPDHRIILRSSLGEPAFHVSGIREQKAIDLLGMNTEIGDVVIIPDLSPYVWGEIFIQGEVIEKEVRLWVDEEPEVLQMEKILFEQKGEIALAIGRFQRTIGNALSLLDEKEAGIFYGVERICFLAIDRSRTLSEILGTPLVIPSLTPVNSNDSE